LTLKHFLLLLSLLWINVSASPRAETVTLAFLGDIMLGRGIASAHTGNVGWENLLAPLAPALRAADLAAANLESPVTARPLVEGKDGESRPAFDLRAGPEGLAASQAAGLDLLSVANNHALDSGPDGRAETRAALAGAGLRPLGYEAQPTFIQVRGIRLAFFAFTDWPDPLDVNLAAQAIRNACQSGALAIVSVHWGLEYHPAPHTRQRELAQAFSKAGAALVWGHHPHVLQPLEWLPSETLERPTLVAYSLGNAVFDQVAPPDARRSALILVKMDQAGVQSVQAIPFEMDVPGGRLVAARPEAGNAVHHRLGEIVRRTVR
jgi:poly-gamma-glutamate synthesis protein (capsule biosynthesis protein)